MLIHNAGYNYCHDADFIIERPNGYQDYLLLLLRTPAIFTIDGKDFVVPENSFFLYKKDRPQYYRCLPHQTFGNDWIHFDFENDKEEEMFSSLGLQYEKPIKIDNPNVIHFYIKAISLEHLSGNVHSKSSIKCYMQLIFNKVSEQLLPKSELDTDNNYAKLSTIRNKIYNDPQINRSIDFAAHEVRMSKSNFQMLYKKFFGISFIHDLINSRIEHAKMLLLNTSMTIAEIAETSGYHSCAHFSRQFKQLVGVTPLEYREKNTSSDFR